MFDRTTSAVTGLARALWIVTACLQLTACHSQQQNDVLTPVESPKSGGAAAGDLAPASNNASALRNQKNADVSGACNAVVNTAAVIQQTKVNQAMPSPTTGGTIAAGTYYLTDSKIYQGAPSGVVPLHIQATQSITGNNMQTVQHVGNSANSTRDTRSFATAGTSLSISLVCGGSGMGTLGYDVVGNQYITYNGAAKTVSVWTRQ